MIKCKIIHKCYAQVWEFLFLRFARIDGGNHMKRRNQILVSLLSIIVVIVSINTVSAASYGLDGYNNDYVDIKTRIPLDIWYQDISDGTTEFPIHVEVKTLSHNSGGYKLVADVIHLNVQATDITNPAWTAPSWLTIADYHVLCTQYGTTRSDTYKIGVSGGFGDGEGYSVGALFQWQWTYYSSSIQGKWMDYIEEVDACMYNLGTIKVDISEQGGHSNEDVGMTFVVGIPNQSARTRDGNEIIFRTKVTVFWRYYYYHWLFGWIKTTTTDSESHIVWIGENSPSGDAKLYLLEALEWTGSYS